MNFEPRQKKAKVQQERNSWEVDPTELQSFLDSQAALEEMQPIFVTQSQSDTASLAPSMDFPSDPATVQPSLDSQSPAHTNFQCKR